MNIISRLQNQYQKVKASIGTVKRSLSGLINVKNLDAQSNKYWRQTSPKPTTQTRWEPGDDERALLQADSGNLQAAAKMVEAMLGDATIYGVLQPKIQGLIRLPLEFQGLSQELITKLQGQENEPGSGEFWQLFPERELIKLQLWGEMLGVGIAEMVKEDDQIHLHTLEPQFLQYRWSEDKWYYQTASALEEVIPGNGRWILYTPYGEDRPWLYGKWRPCAAPFIQKRIALLDRGRWSERMGNGILWAEGVNTTTQNQREGFVQDLIDFDNGPVIYLPEGMKLNLLESGGKGFEVWSNMVEEADKAIIIALASQLSTTLGSKGFNEGDVQERMMGALLQASADTLSECLRNQWLIVWADSQIKTFEPLTFYSVEETPYIRWNAEPPESMEAKAQAVSTLSDAISKAKAALQGTGKSINIAQLFEDLGVPLTDDPLNAPIPQALPITEEIQQVPQQETKAEIEEQDGPTHREILAQQMTELQVEQCEHAKKNRCWICGIERERGVSKDEQGNTVWKVAWKPIDSQKLTKHFASIKKVQNVRKKK